MRFKRRAVVLQAMRDEILSDPKKLELDPAGSTVRFVDLGESLTRDFNLSPPTRPDDFQRWTIYLLLIVPLANAGALKEARKLKGNDLSTDRLATLLQH